MYTVQKLSRYRNFLCMPLVRKGLQRVLLNAQLLSGVGSWRTFYITKQESLRVVVGNKRMKAVELTAEPANLCRTWLVHNLRVADLSRADSTELYVRREMIPLWYKLETNLASSRPIAIAGSPGIGKSMEVYGFVMHLATNEESRKNVVVVRAIAQVLSVFGVIKGIGYANETLIRSLDAPVDVPRVLKGFMLLGNIDVVLIDGNFSSLSDTVFHVQACVSKAFVVVCTSLQGFRPKRVSADELQFERYEPNAWELSDIHGAYRAGLLSCLPQGVSIDDVYYFAGGCIRSFKMFESLEILRSDVNELIKRIGDVDNFLSSAVGDSSTHAINSLRAKYDQCTETGFVSRYVTPRLLEKGGTKVVESCYNLCGSNAALKGWVFEADFMQKMTRLREVRIVCSTKGPLKADNVAPFNLASTAKAITCNSTTFFKPEAWNQGFFHGVLVCRTQDKLEIDFIQCTQAKVHSFICSHCVTFINWLMKGLKLDVGFDARNIDLCVTVTALVQDEDAAAAFSFVWIDAPLLRHRLNHDFEVRIVALYQHFPWCR
jgi:hypothetical protein